MSRPSRYDQLDALLSSIHYCIYYLVFNANKRVRMLIVCKSAAYDNKPESLYCFFFKATG